ncbi:PPE family protein [Mycobacterium saskatchewanense]|uniref:PPE family protein n=1 Tax=Mycobacterium saskatchewanense TaxID=220927 RepID=A0AAJ3NR23_9MYCO|nr:PPE family protein [Mycobacterium saskatchewanense]ORW72251.1 hypothetical protein AWC23_10055 [Mycobacterium saskatchewanense]BBX63895.1 PPE family protein [Mycobacterium saskatchewanense]
MLDYAALPPEINSARMYLGAGSEPLITAAATWDRLASELTSAATSHQSVISELTSGPWLGPSSASMTAAALAYVEWMTTTAAQAEQTADQARSAAAAYEAAFAATVPPPLIAANRTLLASLVATNIIGQNGAAIAAAEAQYAEMWAQDAAAMYRYAAGSAAATTLTAFTAAPQTTTNSSAPAAQAAAAGTQASSAAGQSLLSQVPAALQSLLGGGTNPLQALADLINEFNATPLGSALSPFLESVGLDNTFLSGVTFFASGPLFMLGPLMSLALPNLGVNGGLVAAAATSVTAAPDAVAGLANSSGAGTGPVSLVGADVSAKLGRAASVGGLAVPQAWGSAAPEIRLVGKPLPMPGLDALPEAGAAGPGGWFGGMPPVASVVNAPRSGASYRPETRRKVVAQMPGEESVTPAAIQSREPMPERRGLEGEAAMSERERFDLERLRDELADLVMERDAAARLIKEAIRP